MASRSQAPARPRRTSAGPASGAVGQAVRAFAEQVCSLPSVEDVYVNTKDGDTLHLWTLLTSDDAELRQQIYRVEAGMYDQFPSLEMDFFVLTLERLKEQRLDSLLPNGFVRVREGKSRAFKRAV